MAQYIDKDDLVAEIERIRLCNKTGSTWKPTDEQMEALKAMARYCDIVTSFDAHKQRVVESLIGDLKKLKEE